MEQRKETTFIRIVCIVCFITNLSQLPALIDTSVNRLLSNSAWILLACICVLKNRNIRTNRPRTLLFLAIAFSAFYFPARMLNSAYASSALPQPFYLSIFIFIIGGMVGEQIDESDFNSIFKSYIYSGLVVTANIYFSYIRGASLSRFYLYGSKNSVSQIVLTVWILIIIMGWKDSPFFKRIFYAGTLLFVTYTLLMLQSRSTIIGIPIVVLWLIIHRQTNSHLKRLLVIGLVILLIMLMVNDSFYDFLVNQVLTGGRNVNDINDLTSNRYDEWQNFWPQMKDTFLFGHGRDKQESVILTSLLEFGVVGGGIMLIAAIYPCVWSMRNQYWLGEQYIVISSIAIVYAVNGIFEQLAPFGPGVKCYFLWFLLGIMMRKVEYAQYEYYIEG